MDTGDGDACYAGRMWPRIWSAIFLTVAIAIALFAISIAYNRPMRDSKVGALINIPALTSEMAAQWWDDKADRKIMRL